MRMQDFRRSTQPRGVVAAELVLVALLLSFVLLGGGAAFAATEPGIHGDGSQVRAVLVRPAPVSETPALHPAVVLIVGAFLVMLLPRWVRAAAVVALPAFSFWYIFTVLEPGMAVTLPLMDFSLEVLRVDRLSKIFAMILSAVGVIACIYAFHHASRREQAAALLYNAGAIGVTFAGDYFTLYAFWELMAIASTVLIWARRSPASAAAGKRYVLVHLLGGAILLGGILVHYHETGSIAFEQFDPDGTSRAAWWVLIGFLVNAAVPPLGSWLPDSYPRATITGAIFCSALTTKTAVYALIRGFPGWEILVVLGVIMALYGVVYAVLANDIRELLAYHIISQVGYMVAGVGLGSELSINGATAHAVCHILYKSVLFMGAGAVIYTTGKEKLTELGGFVRRQKLIFGLYMIGAFSISGFPLWNGFISKSMVTAAAHGDHSYTAFMLLMLASVGTFLHTGLKLPYGIWFGKDVGIEPTKVPVNMVVALAIGGLLCTWLGIQPGVLYEHLPFVVNWNPYTASHIVEMVQLLVFTFFVFYLFIPKLGGEPTISMDTDVLYRKSAPLARAVFVSGISRLFTLCADLALAATRSVTQFLRNPLDKIPGSLERLPSDEPGYDEDRDRRSFGVSLTLTLLAFVVLAVWTLWVGRR